MASTFVDEGVYSRVIQSVPIVFFFFRPQSLKTPFLFYFALSKVIHCFWSIPPPYVDGNISKVSITCVHGCKVKKKAGDVMICFRLTVKKKRFDLGKITVYFGKRDEMKTVVTFEEEAQSREQIVVRTLIVDMYTVRLLTKRFPLAGGGFLISIGR